MVRRRTRLWLGCGIVAAAFALSGVASAATVTITEAFQFAKLTYTAAPGEQNAVTINPIDPFPFFGGWTVTETGPGVTLTPGAGCSSLNAQTVQCPSAQTEANLHIAVTLADLDDSASLASACGYAVNEEDFPCARVDVDGGAGNDRIVANDVTSSPLTTTVRGGGGNDLLIAGEMGTVLYGGPGSDNLSGAGGIDHLYAGDGGDSVFAGANNDLVRGGPGNDKLHAGYGADRVEAGSGSDTIYARDRRRDVLRGGTGNDRGRVDRRLDAITSIESFF
jgi:Ca2+-binding RTX toxin-like protein